MSVILLTKQSSPPAAPAASKGKVYLDNSTPAIIKQVLEDGTVLSQIDNRMSAAAASVAAVSGGYASETYLAGSCITLPAAGLWKQGAQYQCSFDMTKTAAGTATIQLIVRMGTAGTTADAAIQTINMAGAGTANADTGFWDVWVNFRAVGGGTSAIIATAYRVTKTLTTTGLINTATIISQAAAVAASGFNSTTQTKIGLTFNGGASFSGTNTFVQASFING